MYQSKKRTIKEIIYDSTERELDQFDTKELTPEDLFEMIRKHDARKYGIFYPIYKQFQIMKGNSVYRKDNVYKK